MTDEQFQKMYAVEVAKLAALNAIHSTIQGIAVKQGAVGGGKYWDHTAQMLKSAEALISSRQQQS